MSRIVVIGAVRVIEKEKEREREGERECGRGECCGRRVRVSVIVAIVVVSFPAEKDGEGRGLAQWQQPCRAKRARILVVAIVPETAESVNSPAYKGGSLRRAMCVCVSIVACKFAPGAL